MADFSLAHPFIVKNEGGYVNDPRDKGGETYKGITRKNFKDWAGWPTVDAAKPLKKGQIIADPELDKLVDAFYKVHFWDNCKLDTVSNQGFATYFYDFHVTAGRNATRVLQQMLGIDPATGNFGPKTHAAVNSYSGDLLGDFHHKRLEYYTRIGVGTNAVFLKGWLNRSNTMYKKLK